MKKFILFSRILCVTLFLFSAAQNIVCIDKVQRTIELLLAQTDPFCEAFFIPDDPVKQLLIELIKQEKKQILAALYSFTEPDVADALVAAFDRGVDVQMIADVEGLRGKYERVTALYDAGIPVFLYTQYRSIMHNKYLIFTDSIGGNVAVWSGSANITKGGLAGNEENVQVTTDPILVNEYRQGFENTKQRIRDAKKNKVAIRPYCSYVGNKLLVKFASKMRHFRCF